jgi:hypothetical protein
MENVEFTIINEFNTEPFFLKRDMTGLKPPKEQKKSKRERRVHMGNTTQRRQLTRPSLFKIMNDNAAQPSPSGKEDQKSPCLSGSNSKSCQA